jgi:Uma2 family endonuclease
MATASRLLNYEEWLALPAGGEGREECVNGVIEKMPPAKFGHAWIVKRLTRQLESQFDETKIFVADSDFGLVIRQHPVTQRTPDVAVFVLADMVEKDGYIHSPPELAIEVLSPANSPRRVRELLADYASIGLPEVWIIDPADRRITIHTLENETETGYRATELAPDGVTQPLRFPSVTVDFASIWP